jgi:hypothetical protein
MCDRLAGFPPPPPTSLLVTVIEARRYFASTIPTIGRLCGLVVSVEDYKHRGPGFDSRALMIFLRELGLERGPLSLVIG